MNRPASIILFERLYLAVIVISIVGIALSWTSLREMAGNQPGVPESVASGILVGALIFGFLIPLLLLYFIARRASNIAKWIFVALTALSVYFFIDGLADPAMPKGILLAVNVVTLVMTLYCTWLLFKPDAKAWLESRGVVEPTDPQTFD